MGYKRIVSILTERDTSRLSEAHISVVLIIQLIANSMSHITPLQANSKVQVKFMDLKFSSAGLSDAMACNKISHFHSYN